jgi:AcrR family transcriptional regulator
MSYEGTIEVDGVEYERRLPPGRHGIPHELVLANQRERLLRAATEIFAARGYAALSVARVIERAGVSRQTFYGLFENKPDCVLAAQRRAFERLREAIDSSCAGAEDWPAGVAAAVPAVLSFAAENPDQMRLILATGNPTSEPALSRDGIAVNEWLAELLREGSQRHPEARSPNAITEQATIGAALSIVAGCITDRRVGPLKDLRTALVRIILAPYLGGEEAARVAEAAR